jgi:hypothetical protein
MLPTLFLASPSPSHQQQMGWGRAQCLQLLLGAVLVACPSGSDTERSETKELLLLLLLLF